MDPETREQAKWINANRVTYNNNGGAFTFIAMLNGIIHSGQDPSTFDITMEWLTEQGECLAQSSFYDVRDDRCWGLEDLVKVRQCLTTLGVSCENWVVSEADVTAAFIRAARKKYISNQRFGFCGYASWEILVMWGKGYIPNLDVIAPDGLEDHEAHDLVIAGAVWYAKRDMYFASRCDLRGTSGFILEQLAEMIPRLDEVAIKAFQRAGIPTDPDRLTRLHDIYSLRYTWRELLSHERENELLSLSVICQSFLVEKNPTSREIGTTNAKVWGMAQDWVAARMASIREGHLASFSELEKFIEWSGLKYEAFGIDTDQWNYWLATRATVEYASARANNGSAALRVILLCETEPFSYEQITGETEETIKPVLEQIIASYAAELRSTVVEHSLQKEVEEPYFDLLALLSKIETANEAAADAGRPPVVDDSAYQLPPKAWEAFHYQHFAGV